MGRTSARRAGAPRGRRTLDGLVLSAAAVVLAFAVVGVASAGKYVADRVSGSATATPTGLKAGTSRAEIARANAQATAIVKSARVSSRTIVKRTVNRARSQAQRMLAAARKRANAIASTPPGAAGTTSGPSTTTGGATGSTTQGTTGTSGVVTFATPVPTLAVPTVTLQNTPVGAPDLSSVPASWLVVGYNATFGGGPGSAGGISVVNRGSKAFSGTVRVTYARGGVATATFSGLAPGQSLVLPLNGPAYPGGGYSIRVIV